MGYNYNFALGSVFFMGLTAAFYLRQKRIHDLQDHLYTVMLLGGLTAIVFDFLAAAIEPAAITLPRWLLYSVNILFVLGEQSCLPAFLLYALAATGKYDRTNRLTRSMAMIPYFAILCLLVVSTLGEGGIFYIDAQNVYRPGALHWALYAAAGAYLVSACLVFTLNFKVIAYSKRLFIWVFVTVIVLAMLIQAFHPRYLLATSATALALTAMFYLLRAPGEQVDLSTGALCRHMLPGILQDLHKKKKPYTLLLFSVLNFAQIVHTNSPQLADELLASLSARLRSGFPSGVVVYMNGAKFTVVIEKALEGAELRRIARQSPETLTTDSGEIPVTLAAAAIVHRDDGRAEESLTTIDYLFRQMPEGSFGDIFIADTAYQDRCGRMARLEVSMERVLREGTPVLLTSPVQRLEPDGALRTAGLDVSLGLEHEELWGITNEELLLAIRNSGSILWYYERLTALAGAIPGVSEGKLSVCMPLMPSVLIQSEMTRRLFDLVTAAGMDPRRVVLRLVEKDVAGDISVVQDNIRRLSDVGFGFRLDGFAAGYTDMSLLSDLPITGVMVDGSLLAQAGRDERSRALLKCVIGIMGDMGKKVICGGVETDEDSAIAAAAGARMFHGKWCLR